MNLTSLTRRIPNGITSAVGRQVLQGQKHSPTILFAGGVVGVVVTAVLASRATLKVDEVLQDAKNDLELAKSVLADDSYNGTYDEKDYAQDVAHVYVRTTVRLFKLYSPAVLAGGLTIAALTGSHRMLTNRNLALGAAYATLDKSFTEYRRRVVDELGEEKDRQFRHSPEISKVVAKTGEDSEVDKKGDRLDPNSISGYARFFDAGNPSWQGIPEFDLLWLRCKQNWANDRLRSRGHIFLNEVYDDLNIPRTKEGAVVGWVLGKNGDNYVDFGLFNGDNPGARDFVNGFENAILLDFNVDGVIFDKI